MQQQCAFYASVLCLILSRAIYAMTILNITENSPTETAPCYQGEYGACACKEFEMKCSLRDNGGGLILKSEISKTFASIHLDCYETGADINKILNQILNIKADRKINLTMEDCLHLPDVLSRREIAHATFQFGEPPEDFFQNSNCIEELEVITLYAMPPKFLENLNYTKHLALTVYDESEDLPMETFTANLHTLERLKLELGVSHKAFHFTNAHFRYLKPLKQLNIYDTTIDEFAENTFASLTELSHLSLQSNRLRAVHGGLLSAQQKLVVLDLSRNKLKSLPTDLFKETHLLSELYLRGNQLSNPTNIIDCLRPLRHLRILELSQNEFESISGTNFYENETLLTILDVVVSMSELPLPLGGKSLLAPKSIDQAINFSRIDISSNPVTRHNINWHNSIPTNTRLPIVIDASNELFEYFSLSLPAGTTTGKRRIYFPKDPFKCRCAIKRDNDSCNGGNPYVSLNVDELSYADSCQWQPLDCPSKCVCYWNNEMFKINCSGRGINEISELPRPAQLGFQHITLDISYNNFRKLPTTTILGYANVTRLYAMHNQIAEIRPEHLPPNLTILELSNNQLAHLCDDLLASLLKHNERLSELYLAGNPWQCNCGAEHLLFAVREHRKRIADLAQLCCVNEPEKLFFNLLYTDICVIKESSLLTVYIVLSSTLILMLIIVAVGLTCRTPLRIWLYNHNMCFPCVNERELDVKKTFDAFISYAHQDAEFVNGVLLPQLELGVPAFKICTHERNWLAGAYIPEQIIESVDQSRRTIIVLSQHFIESVWSRMEFRTAHQCSLNAGRARIIIIKYGEITCDETLDKELEFYLEMNTHLDWQDARFWPKLRYAMPHKTGEAQRAGMLETGRRVYVMGEVEGRQNV